MPIKLWRHPTSGKLLKVPDQETLQGDPNVCMCGCGPCELACDLVCDFSMVFEGCACTETQTSVPLVRVSGTTADLISGTVEGYWEAQVLNACGSVSRGFRFWCSEQSGTGYAGQVYCGGVQANSGAPATVVSCDPLEITISSSADAVACGCPDDPDGSGDWTATITR